MGARWDAPEAWPVSRHTELARGAVAAFDEDVITSPEGQRLSRQYLRHPGSVAVIALDDDDRVAVVHQYRHAVAARLVEPPAGLLDKAGEPAFDAVRRELAEEAGLVATDWRVLVDFVSSPGISQEIARIYLARGLTHTGRPDGFTVEGEEADMGLDWVGLDDIMAAIRAGRVNNPALILGCTTLKLALAEDTVDDLRPADAPWPARENKVLQDARLDG
ncbi:MAG: NUDIX hydrolase [Actinomycetia bacterium]|nr:NUDIX hydrolase [Actinomycetes bacterium]